MEWNDLLHILLIIVCPLVFLGGIWTTWWPAAGLITLPALSAGRTGPPRRLRHQQVRQCVGHPALRLPLLAPGEIRMPSAAWGAAGALAGAWAGAAFEPHPAGSIPLLHHAGHRSGDGRLSPFEAGLRDGGPLRPGLPCSASPSPWPSALRWGATTDFSAPERAPSSCWPIPASANSICSPPPATQRRPTPPPTPPPWSPSPWRARWFGP